MNPADELVVLVNERNEVVGQTTRRRMRAGRLLHRSTYILVFNSAGQIYVQKRTMTKDIYPGYWDPATGGVVAAGETYEQGAERELAEEMGIRGVPLKTHFDLFYEDERSQVWGRVFSCQWDGPVTPQPEEVQYVELMTPDEIRARSATETFTPDGLVVVDRYLRGA